MNTVQEGATASQDNPGGSRGSMEPEGATASQEPHGHPFKVKFNQKKSKEENIFCDEPCTVLQAIKSLDEYKKKVTRPDENIIIQMGTGDYESSIATHFPCSCIGHDEVLTISCKTEAVEKAQHDFTGKIYTRDKYSVFYIDKDGGENTKTKDLFKNNAVKKFKYLCVYGEKEITVKEALKRDGRFVDMLFDVNFKLIENQKSVFECKHKLGNMDNKKFKICLPRGQNTKTEVKLEQLTDLSSPLASEGSQTRKKETRSVLDVAQQKDISVKQAVKETGSSIDPLELYKLLCEQFPHLKQHMEMRFPDNSLLEALNLRKENFGKIEQAFTEVHRVRELIELADSVCLLQVHVSDSSAVQGTGFVLFDNFVLTNAHLFKYWVDSGLPNWWESVNVTAVFNFEKQDSDKKMVKANVFGGKPELDYAILELETEQAPPGLLKRLGPLPLDGGACIVGHPAGGVKKMDPTCVIEKKKREEAVNKNLEDYKEYFITLCAINQAIKNDPYKNIRVTYNTFMYHGSSGSPVFDAHGRVFGLHSGGFFYGIPKADESVLEFAFPLLTILENFVGNLKQLGEEKLLERIEEEGKGNPYLDNIIATVVGPKQSRP